MVTVLVQIEPLSQDSLADEEHDHRHTESFGLLHSLLSWKTVDSLGTRLWVIATHISMRLFPTKSGEKDA
jgi:hypothetical protein